jgi:hypothetical protein
VLLLCAGMTLASVAGFEASLGPNNLLPIGV